MGESETFVTGGLLTAAEVARVMRVSTMTVYRLIKSGELPAIRVGKNFRIRESDVEFLLPSHGPIFRKDNHLIDATIARLESYTHMADFGTCAVDWPLMDAWEEELARGQLDF